MKKQKNRPGSMEAWENFIQDREEELGSETANKWLRSLTVMHFDACNLYLEAKDAFHANWFEEHIRPKITALCNNNNKRIKVHLSVKNAPGKSKKRLGVSKDPPALPFSLIFDSLNPNYTFQRFVVSETNAFPYKLLFQICGQEKNHSNFDGMQFNPIYLYGSPGSGKTHLLMAAAAALREKGIDALYAHTQTFTDHLVSAIRAGEMRLFRQAYRKSEVLIIDDVHVLSRKGATQEEFFHTFNTLHLSGKQIILGSNVAPGELQQIEPRLVSRFEWGIVMPLEPPSKQECTKILKLKEEAMQFPLHPKVLDFLMKSFSSLVSLIQAFEALVLRSHLNQQSSHNPQRSSSLHITIQNAKELLKDLIKKELESALTPEVIIKSTAEFFGIRPEDIFGSSQTRDCVLPRQICMHFCRNELKMPYVKIGNLFSKDHSTVMASVKLIQKAIDSEDKEISPSYRMIGKKLKNIPDNNL